MKGRKKKCTALLAWQEVQTRERRAEDTAAVSSLLAGSNTISSASLWWDSLSGSLIEETAAKAAIAMALRGRWRWKGAKDAILPAAPQQGVRLCQ